MVAPVLERHERLQRVRAAAAAEEDERQPRRGRVRLPPARPHAHEDAHVEVDAERDDRRRVSPVAVCVRLDAAQQDAQRHLVAERRAHRDGAVARVTRGGRVAAQHRDVGARHAQQAVVGDRLDGRVEERRRRPVRVQVDDVEAIAPPPGGVQQRGCVGAARRHQVLDAVVTAVATDVGDGRRVVVVADDLAHAERHKHNRPTLRARQTEQTNFQF